MVMVYITIPALSSFPKAANMENGTLDPMKNDMESLLRRYTIREVTLVRRCPCPATCCAVLMRSRSDPLWSCSTTRLRWNHTCGGRVRDFG